MKIDIIITAYKEAGTIGKAIEAFLDQGIKEKFQIIAAAPDKETLDVIAKYEKRHKNVKHFKDPGKGKMLCLNLLFKKLKGDILVLSDGDVYADENAVENILKHFEDGKVGCVTGHPMPTNSKEDMFGYWAHLFTYMVHRSRASRYRKGKYFTSTGYLFAFRNGIVKEFDRDIPEDAIIPFTFMEEGYKIVYEENAKVYVKYPDNFDEWLSQKKRIRKAYLNL